VTTEHTDTDRLERICNLVLRLNADDGLSPGALSGLQRLTQSALDASRTQRAAQETPVRRSYVRTTIEGGPCAQCGNKLRDHIAVTDSGVKNACPLAPEVCGCPRDNCTCDPG
jgi:hypothetical protein